MMERKLDCEECDDRNEGVGAYFFLTRFFHMFNPFTGCSPEIFTKNRLQFENEMISKNNPVQNS